MIKTLLQHTSFQKSTQVGLLCNHTAWHADTGSYLFRSLAHTHKLKRVFIPEHGLFGELQDQEKLSDTSCYHSIAQNVEWVSLYSDAAHGITAAADHLKDLDCIIIDIQDAGCRYYTFTSSIFLLLQQLSKWQLNTEVIVLDKPNPAGRQVEGTRITQKYSSFIGIEGLPHRHGLTIGELCKYFQHTLGGKWTLNIIPFERKENIFIPPSPNIPTKATCKIYSGQCLWEGTNFSEGRGTAIPFQVTGAPFADWVFSDDWNQPSHPLFHNNAQLRPVKFIPTFHKYKDEACYGLHLLVKNKDKFHSLAFSLQLIKYCKEKTKEFAWRPGAYEALNDRTAIELLAGDDALLGYLNDTTGWKEVAAKIADEEKEWIKEVTPFLIYKQNLKQTKIKTR